jgi:hypothetical protein
VLEYEPKHFFFFFFLGGVGEVYFPFQTTI